MEEKKVSGKRGSMESIKEEGWEQGLVLETVLMEVVEKVLLCSECYFGLNCLHRLLLDYQILHYIDH